MSRGRILPVIIVCALVSMPAQPRADHRATRVAQQEQSGGSGAAEKETVAKRRFSSAKTLLDKKSYKEALNDLKAIVGEGPNSFVDDALLLMANYFLEIENSLDEAQVHANQLVGGRSDTEDKVPAGHLILGRIALARGRTPEHFQTAIANYSRVVDGFPGHNEEVAEALYRMAEAQRLNGLTDEAISNYQNVCAAYSISTWCAKAALGMAVGLVRTGHWPRAVERLQWVRTNFPDSPESVTAYQWNTTLFRLYLRPSQPFAPGGRPPLQVNKVDAMVVDAKGRLLLASSAGVRVFDDTGTPQAGFGSAEFNGVFLGERGRVFAFQSGSLVPEQGTPTSLSFMKDGKPKPVGDILAAVTLSTGEFLVAAKDAGPLQSFSPSGENLRPQFSAAVRADRLAVNELDDVAVLDLDSKAISLWRPRDGAMVSLGSIPAGVLKNPVDIAFDPFGHLYVLDRDPGSVVVFAPFERTAQKFVSFAIPEKRARAFALDQFGRLFIFDDKEKRVLIYQ